MHIITMRFGAKECRWIPDTVDFCMLSHLYRYHVPSKFELIVTINLIETS